jgi:hypothetical protein
MSDALTKLPAALAKFQSQIHAAGRDGKGNYGTYTTLAGALAAVQNACQFGLSHTQTLHPLGEDTMVLRTTLMHESGESVYSDLPLPIRFQGGRSNEMQAMGSALTYARRYGLLGIYGIAGDDDDGEDAAPVKPQLQQTKPQPAKSVKSSPTPAQPQAKQAKAEPSTDLPPDVQPPLDPAERSEILQLLKEMMSSNKTAFDQFIAEYRSTFGLAANASVSNHLQEQQHADFAQKFFASLPAA